MIDRSDRYMREELSPAEARELAQAALDSPELFDELTGAALAKAALNPRTVRRATVMRSWRARAVIAAGLAAAAAAFVWIALPQRPTTPIAQVKPGLGVPINAAQPILLASGLQPANAPVFRGGAPDSRAPQSSGAIVSIEHGSANINVGSLDGLAKDTVLQVLRGSSNVGTLEVTTVFRDRARARVIDGEHLAPNDQVRVGPADHLTALLQQAEAEFNRGDPDAALKLADEAVRWGQSAAVDPRSMAAPWNMLAVLHMLRGEYRDAEPLLSRAASAVSKADPAYGEIQNNLGVMAELQGDRARAAASYNQALSALGGDRRLTVERNLVHVQGSR